MIDIPFILAGDDVAREAIMRHIGKGTHQCRIVTSEVNLKGHYNGTLYVGHNASYKLVRVAEARGFTIVNLTDV